MICANTKCGASFKPKTKRSRCCSQRCVGALFMREKAATIRNVRPLQLCASVRCSRMFRPFRANAIFCSLLCKQLAVANRRHHEIASHSAVICRYCKRTYFREMDGATAHTCPVCHEKARAHTETRIENACPNCGIFKEAVTSGSVRCWMYQCPTRTQHVTVEELDRYAALFAKSSRVAADPISYAIGYGRHVDDEPEPEVEELGYARSSVG